STTSVAVRPSRPSPYPLPLAARGRGDSALRAQREGEGGDGVVAGLLAGDHMLALHLAVDDAEGRLHVALAPADADLGVADQGAGGSGGPPRAVPAVFVAQHVEAHGPTARGGEQVPAAAVAEAGA